MKGKIGLSLVCVSLVLILSLGLVSSLNDKNLVANGFDIVNRLEVKGSNIPVSANVVNTPTEFSLGPDESSVSSHDASAVVYLNYSEFGLQDCQEEIRFIEGQEYVSCKYIEDDYATEYAYSYNGGESFRFKGASSRLGLDGSKGAFYDFTFVDMLAHKLLFRGLITLRVKMDYVSDETLQSWQIMSDSYNSQMNLSSGDEGFQNISLTNNMIQEVDESDNCIEQDFRVKLLIRELIADGPARRCEIDGSLARAS